MIREWIKNVIQEAVFKLFVELETRITLMETDISVIKIILDKQEKHLQSLAAQEQSSEEQEPVHALASSRPSWMRMKKQFEERDVRGIIAAQNAEKEEFVGNRHPSHEQQVAAVANYWQQKQKGQGI